MVVILASRVGWKGNRKRLYGCSVHVDIKDGKVWVQHDGSEVAIAVT
ncbi:MAG: element excision factor XisI family protein [Leptolyngbyaceae cyanobacterium]